MIHDSQIVKLEKDGIDLLLFQEKIKLVLKSIESRRKYTVTLYPIFPLLFPDKFKDWLYFSTIHFIVIYRAIDFIMGVLPLNHLSLYQEAWR